MPPISNKILDVFNHYQNKLQAIYSEEEAKSIIYLLFNHLFGINRLDIFLNSSQKLSESEIVTVHDVTDELLQYIPIQYITGVSVFCGLQLEVNPATLIPRPETEELVNFVSQNIKNNSLKVLDIGTGSGAIAIALKNINPHIEMFACDISKEALQTAQENAKRLVLDVHFFEMDILNYQNFEVSPQFDIIVSNPPYIPAAEKEIMNQNITDYEPSIALFVPDENPLVFYKAIIKFSLLHLKEKGKLFFEIHEQFGTQIISLLEEYGFKNCIIKKDVFDKDRIVVAEKE